MNRIGYNVKRLLAARGMTQNALAQAAGIDKGNLSRTISGEFPPGLRKIERLAEALQADPVEFFQPIPQNHADQGCKT